MQQVNVFFDWDQQKTQPITLEMLERTHRETDVYGNPLKGVFHFELVNSILDMCDKVGYETEIYDMFAAQNRDRTQPGVVKLPQVEQRVGENAVEAHILRRVFTNIRIKDFDDEETTTNLAVAFHQKGIQIGFGPNVKICHNQCMLSPQQYVCSYSEKGQRGTGLPIVEMLERVQGWLVDAKTLIQGDREKIKRMKDTEVKADEVIMLIGLLTAMRVKADTQRKIIKENTTYPLNQSQITVFTEDMLEAYASKDRISLWDVYNSATELYKATRMDIPQLLPQNRAFVKFIGEHFNIF